MSDTNECALSLRFVPHDICCHRQPDGVSDARPESRSKPSIGADKLLTLSREGVEERGLTKQSEVQTTHAQFPTT